MWWGATEVPMMPKLGKPPNLIPSDVVVTNHPEKLFVKCLKPVIAKTKLIPLHQLGFTN